MMQLLERLTVVYEQNTMVHSHMPGLHPTVAVFMGHGDVNFVGDFLLELDTYRIASSCTEAYLSVAVIPVALLGSAAS